MRAFDTLCWNCADSTSDLKFLDVFIYKVASGPKRGLAWLVQNILPEDAIQEYTVERSSRPSTKLEVLDCFSHFCYEATKGECLMTEFEGYFLITRRR